MKDIRRRAALIACLATVLASPALAADAELIFGPGMYFDQRSGSLGSIGVTVGAGLHRPITGHTDLGLVLAGSLFDSQGEQFQAASWLQLRQRVAGRFSLLLGAGGVVVETGNPYDNAWEGFFYPVIGATWDLPRTALELRYSPGDAGPLLNDHGSLWLAFRKDL